MFPERANIGFARIVGRTEIELKVWERGAGPTLACGTAACAAVVAASRRGLIERHARVNLPGGPLDIEWRASDSHVLMTGAWSQSFEGALTHGMAEGSGA
jgi:diaminopimelate epimerase